MPPGTGRRSSAPLVTAAVALSSAVPGAHAQQSSTGNGYDCSTADEWASAQWVYRDGPLGPTCWHSLNLECAGQQQSPIELRRSDASQTKSKFFHVWPTNGTNWLGEALAAWQQQQGTAASTSRISPHPTMSLDENGGVRLDVRGLNVTLVAHGQWSDLVMSTITFKVPAEHVVEGVRHDMERQIYFVPRDRQYAASGSAQSLNVLAAAREPFAVLSQFFSEGQDDDKFLTQLRPELAELAAAGRGNTLQLEIPPVIPDFYPTGPVFSYDGSLPFPPCTETVKWYVSPVVHSLTATQLGLLTSSFVNGQSNIRGLQPANARRVQYHGVFRPVRSSPWAELDVCARKHRGNVSTMCTMPHSGVHPGCPYGASPPVSCVDGRDAAAGVQRVASVDQRRESDVSNENEDLLQGIISLGGLMLLAVILLSLVLADRCGAPLVSKLPLGLAADADPQVWTNPPMPGICIQQGADASESEGSGEEEETGEEDEEVEEGEDDFDDGA